MTRVNRDGAARLASARSPDDLRRYA